MCSKISFIPFQCTHKQFVDHKASCKGGYLCLEPLKYLHRCNNVTVNQTYYTIRGHNKRRGRNKIKLICIVRPGQAGPDTHTDSKSKLGPLSFTASLNRKEYIKVNVISTIYGLWFYGDWVWHGHYHSIPPSLVRLHCGSVTGHTVEEGLNFYNVMNILLSLEDISHFLLS